MTLKYLLDTNICIYITKKKPASVLKYFETLKVGEVAISTITYGELLYGANKSNNSKLALSNLEALSNYIPPLPLSINTGKIYGKIRAELTKKGTPIGANDLWIAAHALSLDITLVTNNEGEFSRIEPLKLENWAR